MHTSENFDSVTARIIFAGTRGLFCSLIIFSPILFSNSYSTAASSLYFYFYRICHPIPGRSRMLSGHPLEVCHRCYGIYIGLFIGSLFENRFIHRSSRTRRFCIMMAAGPLFMDFLSFVGIASGSGASRFLTGLGFGY